MNARSIQGGNGNEAPLVLSMLEPIKMSRTLTDEVISRLMQTLKGRWQSHHSQARL
jgi:hypothetical protein